MPTTVDAELAARASFQTHRLIGWIYWDPVAISRYAALGVPDGRGYYIATRAAPLAPAGNAAVIAAFVSIHAGFIRFALDECRQHTTFEDTYRVRNEAVGLGLRAHVPEIVDELASMADRLWETVDALPLDARVLFAAHAEWPRFEHDPATSAWLALNCIREWRGDTHWAIVAAHDLDLVEAGLLHDAYVGYPGEWVPRSRGAGDDQLAAAWESLLSRGLAEQTDDGRRVNTAGVQLREAIERRTDELSVRSWAALGAESTEALCRLIEPIGDRLMAMVDANAGPNYMPAARHRRPR
jgi:hypothetical protein